MATCRQISKNNEIFSDLIHPDWSGTLPHDCQISWAPPASVGPSSACPGPISSTIAWHGWGCHRSILPAGLVSCSLVLLSGHPAGMRLTCQCASINNLLPPSKSFTDWSMSRPVTACPPSPPSRPVWQLMDCPVRYGKAVTSHRPAKPVWRDDRAGTGTPPPHKAHLVNDNIGSTGPASWGEGQALRRHSLSLIDFFKNLVPTRRGLASNWPCVCVLLSASLFTTGHPIREKYKTI